MGTKESLLVKSLLNTEKIFLEVNTDTLDLDSQIQIVTDALQHNDNEVLKLKLAVLLKAKAIESGETLRGIIAEFSNSYPDIRTTEADVNKRINFNLRMVKLFKEDRVLFDAYRSIVLELGYKVTTLNDNAIYFDKYKVIEDVTSEVVLGIVNEFIDNQTESSLFSAILEKSSVQRECSECKKMLPITSFKISKSECKECHRIKELSKSGGEEAVKAYLTKQCTKDTEENIKEFKAASMEVHETSTVSHSRNYLDIKCQLESLSAFLDELYYTDTSGMSLEESLDINIKCIELNKKLLETERKIYAEQQPTKEQSVSE